MPADRPDPTPAESILPLLHSDPFAALEQLHRNAAPLGIAARYHAVLRHAYWKAHDLPAVITLARAGIAYCLGKSLEPPTPPDLVEKLRAAAKALAYDAGSFTWPGWEEPGIAPTPADLVFGGECARLNLRLAVELKKPPEKLSEAHWLVGAHALAAGDAVLAAEHFTLAQSIVPPTEPAGALQIPLYAGYLAVARLAQNPANPAAKETFDSIIAQFTGRTDEDAATYKSQLLAAHHLFIPPSPLLP